jgi:hypothetical protein
MDSPVGGLGAGESAVRKDKKAPSQAANTVQAPTVLMSLLQEK